MIPNATKKKLFDGAIDLGNDTIKVALLKESTEYSPDPDNHEFVSNVLDGGTTGTEFDDTNYSRKTLANQATSQDNTDDEGVFDADDLTWSSLGGSQTVEAVLVYKQVGGDDTTPGDDPIIRIIDDSEASDLPKATNGDDFTISWNSEGIVNLA